MHTQTEEDCSNFKKREILPFAETWVNLEGFMLSEIRQIQRGKKPFKIFPPASSVEMSWGPSLKEGAGQQQEEG